MRTVDIIASSYKWGYEWFCPDCETGNTETGIEEKVTCTCCGAEFETNPSENIYGG